MTTAQIKDFGAECEEIGLTESEWYEVVDLALKGGMQMTNRVFNGWWGDADKGDRYISEWSCQTGFKGEQYVVAYRFDLVKGDEPEDDNLPWSDYTAATVTKA